MGDRLANKASGGDQLAMFGVKPTERQAKATAAAAIRHSGEIIRRNRSTLFNKRPPLSWSRGFIFVPQELLLDSEISDHAKLLFCLLLKFHFTSPHKRCFPCERTLSKELGKSVRSIQRCLSELSRFGLLQVITRRMPSGRQANEYILNIEDFSSIRRSDRA